MGCGNSTTQPPAPPPEVCKLKTISHKTSSAYQKFRGRIITANDSTKILTNSRNENALVSTVPRNGLRRILHLPSISGEQQTLTKSPYCTTATDERATAGVGAAVVAATAAAAAATGTIPTAKLVAASNAVDTGETSDTENAVETKSACKITSDSIMQSPCLSKNIPEFSTTHLALYMLTIN